MYMAAGHLLPLRAGWSFWERLKDFQTDPPIHPGFSEMNRHKFYILWKWLPHNSEETTNIEATNHTEVDHEYSRIYKMNVY